jgi:hypothetical protein
VRQIISKKEFAERMGRSVRHLERMIAVGEGPPIIKLGPRAVGIAEDWRSLARLASRCAAGMARLSGSGLRSGRPKCGEIRRPASCGRRLPNIDDAGQHEVSGYRTFRRRSRLD